MARERLTIYGVVYPFILSVNLFPVLFRIEIDVGIFGRQEMIKGSVEHANDLRFGVSRLHRLVTAYITSEDSLFTIVECFVSQRTGTVKLHISMSPAWSQ
jgi:hypothetical protein